MGKKKHRKWRPLHEFTVLRSDGTPDTVFSVEALNKQEAARIMRQSGWSWWWQGRKIVMVPALCGYMRPAMPRAAVG